MTAAKSAPGHGPKLTVVEGTQAGSPGQKLMRARTHRNLALEDVARQLNLSVSMVKAIESDNFKSLPGRAFVKGYLRNYAKLVGIDAEDLIRGYESQFGGADDAMLNPPDVARPPRWIAPLVKGLGYLVLLAILVGIGTVVYQNAGVIVEKAQQLATSFERDEAAPASADAAEPVTPVSKGSDTVRLSIPLRPVGGGESAPAGAANATDAQPPATVDTPVATPADSGNKAEGEAVPPQSARESGVGTASSGDTPSSTPPVVSQSSPTAVAAVSEAVATLAQAQQAASPGPSVENIGSRGSDSASVSLVFSGLSWARVRDANDKILFDGTRSAGGQVQLQGVAPFTIRLGNAPVVKVTFNGEPRDFDFSSRSNVAQFTLGDE